MFDKVTYSLLKELYRCEKMNLEDVNKFTGTKDAGDHNKHASFLCEKELIDECYENATPTNTGRFLYSGKFYKINLRGCAFVEQRRRELLNFWVPYLITTIVAVAGLLVAIAGFRLNVQSVDNQDTSNAFRNQSQIGIQNTCDK